MDFHALSMSCGERLALLLSACCILLATCSSKPPEKSEPADDATALVDKNKGSVLVLLMGMKGCSGTATATEVLKEYHDTKPAGVVIARVDVPPPSGKFEPLDRDSLPFAYCTDDDRDLANRLDFFYYPTLYIFGPEGELRFSGDCESASLTEIVAAIHDEKPGDERNVFTPPLLDPGTIAPAFTGTTLDGDEVNLEELSGLTATMLIFAKTNCRFTMQAFPAMKELKDELVDQGVAVVIINRQESAEDIRPIYAEKTPGMIVVHDKDGGISKSYGVPAVPFVFILDAAGRISSRMPFTRDSAEKSAAQVLDPGTNAEVGPVEGAG